MLDLNFETRRRAKFDRAREADARVEAAEEIAGIGYAFAEGAWAAVHALGLTAAGDALAFEMLLAAGVEAKPMNPAETNVFEAAAKLYGCAPRDVAVLTRGLDGAKADMIEAHNGR